ncbi:MAG: hypothetical protein HN583_10365 [Kordiimonadaceae bacterium]|jgi:hypothetical protein|nr:hypothetical protein [Kordiimonadaceae bacterium]MBT6467213.1 hypothetical protein [Kordiimonadaceae bacterium]MBT7606076.1 hypothetical protein [Kordiimonadaceae bacterium]MDB4044156.1 hypothetical protein [Emcibacteraceae bacterium]MDC0081229.1 hypothetical protein [Emcibacteraceae bacterium]
MDLNKIGLHIHEIRNQFTYIEGNVEILNQSLKKNNSVGTFMSLQSIFSALMQVSRILWAPRKKGKARSEAIRKFLGIPEEHPLNNKDIQNLFDFCDEANEEWVKKTAGKHILYDFIGDLGESQHKDVEIENIFRSFDTKGKIYVYRGVGFHMDAVMASLQGTSEAVNKAHYHLFPDQWTDIDEKGDKKPIPKKKVKKKK